MEVSGSQQEGKKGVGGSSYNHKVSLIHPAIPILPN
jgi:hypothetical protein